MMLKCWYEIYINELHFFFWRINNDLYIYCIKSSNLLTLSYLFEQAHPAHAHYLNKKIEQYDEIAIVVGKDMTASGFSKQWSERSPLVENEAPHNDIQNPAFEGDSDMLPKDAYEASN